MKVNVSLREHMEALAEKNNKQGRSGGVSAARSLTQATESDEQFHNNQQYNLLRHSTQTDAYDGNESSALTNNSRMSHRAMRSRSQSTLQSQVNLRDANSNSSRGIITNNNNNNMQLGNTELIKQSTEELEELEEFLRMEKKEIGGSNGLFTELQSPNFAQNAFNKNSQSNIIMNIPPLPALPLSNSNSNSSLFHQANKQTNNINYNSMMNMLRSSYQPQQQQLSQPSMLSQSSRQNSSSSLQPLRKKIFEPPSPAEPAKTLSELVKSKQYLSQQCQQVNANRQNYQYNNISNKENIKGNSNQASSQQQHEPIVSKQTYNSNSIHSTTNNTQENPGYFSNSQQAQQQQVLHQYASFNSINDLQQAREKIKELENNLCKETLNSEEQRSLNNILKAQLERQLQDNGFMNFFKTTNSSSNLSHIDIYLELQVIKGKLAEKEEKLQEVVGIAREATSIREKNQEVMKLNEELQEKNTRTEEKLMEMQRKYQEILEEQEGNQIKANEAIQCIEELTEKCSQLVNENEGLKGQVELIDFEEMDDLKAEKHNLIEFIEKIKGEQEKLEEQLNEANEIAKGYESKVSELQERIIEKEREIMEIQEEQKVDQEKYKELLEEIEGYKEKDLEVLEKLKEKDRVEREQEKVVQEMEEEIARLEEEKIEIVKEYEDKLEDLKRSYSISQERITELTELKRVIEAERISVVKEKDRLTGEVTELKAYLKQSRQSNDSVTFIQNQFESYRQKFEDAKDNIFTLTQTLEDTNDELEQMKVKLKQVEEKGNEKQKELMTALERLEELKEKLKIMEKEKETRKSKEEDEAHAREEQSKLSYQQAQQQLAQLSQEGIQLKDKISQLTADKRAQQLQMEHHKVQSIQQAQKIEELEWQVQQKCGGRCEENAAYYDKKIREIRTMEQNRRQESVAMQVQSALVSDVIQQLSSYVNSDALFQPHFELFALLDDLQSNFQALLNTALTNYNSKSNYNQVKQHFQPQLNHNIYHTNSNNSSSYNSQQQQQLSYNTLNTQASGSLLQQSPMISRPMTAQSQEIQSIRAPFQQKLSQISALKHEQQQQQQQQHSVLPGGEFHMYGINKQDNPPSQTGSYFSSARSLNNQNYYS